MEPNVQYLLIGSGITLISSLLITIVANIFQSMREQKSRLWKIEDDKKREEIYLIKKRIDKAEECVEKLSNMSLVCYSYQEKHLDVARNFYKDEIAVKFIKFLEGEEKSNSSIQRYLKREKINEEQLQEKLNLWKNSFDESARDKEKLKSELALLMREIHCVFVLENEVINKKILEFVDLISSQVRNGLSLPLENITIAKIDKERKKLSELLPQSSRIHGEIIQELDSILVNYEYTS